MATAKPAKQKRLPLPPPRDLSQMDAAERRRLLANISGRTDTSKPNEALEATRVNLEIEASTAAYYLLTLNRQIQPTLDPEAKKALRVVGAVLSMFQNRSLSARQSSLLDRLFSTLSGGDLNTDERTGLAVDAAKNAIRSFSTVDSDAARTNVARHFAIRAHPKNRG